MATYDELVADLKTIEDLAKLTVVDKRGNPSLQFGFLLKLYFSRAYEIEVRERMLRLVEEYGKIFADKITHYMPYEGKQLKPSAAFDYIAYFDDYMRSVAHDEKYGSFSAELYGFPDAIDQDEPTPYHIGIVAMPAIDKKRLGNQENALGRMEAYFPANWAQGDYSKLREILQRWAEISQPIHGTFGIGLVMEEGGPRSTDMPLVFPFLKRYLGFDYPDRGLWRTASRRAEQPVIRSINWLNLLDDSRVELLGGIENIKEELGDSCPVYSYDGGIIIQAGAKPELGDFNKGEMLEDYRTVAHVLKPLRFEAFGRFGLFNGLPSALDDRDETLNWLRRFDLAQRG